MIKRLFIALTLFVAVAGILIAANGISSTKIVTLNGKKLTLEFARTEAQRAQGLSDRASLPIDHGMLFLFSKSDNYPFWMSRMHFPLDMIWIQEGKVVAVHPNVPAPAQNEMPITIDPHVKANRVLEVNAGQAAEYGLKVGTNVSMLP